MNALTTMVDRYTFRRLARRYQHHMSQREFRISVFISIILFFASVTASFYAIQYATERASNSVSDIVLSNVPIFDVDGLFVYGTLLFVVLATLVLLAHPKRIPFTLYSLALFFFIRSGFIMLTHIGPFPIATTNSFDLGTVLSRFFFGGDMFFSGHVGIAFLMALIFWRERGLRNVFIAWSLYMMAVVLLGHLHYSIDVASAFFITYTIFCLSEWLFPKARAIFYSDVPSF